MKFAVYQIDHEKDRERVHFENYKRTIEWAGKIDPTIYRKVWDGDCKQIHDDEVYDFLNQMFLILNLDNKPVEYTGTSMSVSDVVSIGEKAYFVDSVGFEEIPSEGFAARG